MGIQVIANTSFLGSTGYNAHSQQFFIHLNKYIPTRIRNYTYTPKFSDFEKQNLHLLIQQDWQDPPYKIGRPFIPNSNDLHVNIVLNESHHYFFYDKYPRPFIFYNVWESTRQIPEFFNRMLEADQFWYPTKWQRECTINQGYPEDRVKVVPEGVDRTKFFPRNNKQQKKSLFRKYDIPENAFVFMIFGRWDYRKYTTEMIRAWINTFSKVDNCYLVISVDNPFSADGMKTAEERMKHHKFKHERIRILHFPPRDEYIKWLQNGSCLLSCSRSEGWNLPLMEALACGTPSICSDWGGHLEFADGIACKVNVPKEFPPKEVFSLNDKSDFGVWGEPDFDHLQYTMKHVYSKYDQIKTDTLNSSKHLRKLYTWENAAIKANGYIRDLVKNKYYHISSNIKNKNEDFEVSYEIVDNRYPKVYFESLKELNRNLLVSIKAYDGEIKHQAIFSNVKKGIKYWIQSNRATSKVLFDIVDKENNKCLYSEKKELCNTESYSGVELYQEQYVNGNIIKKGKSLSSDRYNNLKKVFDKYKRPFTILDIGANFGYYSIRAATEYNAISVMIEQDNQTCNILTDLCQKNNCRDKLIVLNTKMNLEKLKHLSKCEHFDVVLALNVIHHFRTDEVIEVCKIIENLGDNLILETPPLNDTGACGQNNLKLIFDYFGNKECTSLGRYKRHTSDVFATMVWFENKKIELRWPYYGYEKLFENKRLNTEKLRNRKPNIILSDYEKKYINNLRKGITKEWEPGINLKTFVELHGIFPNIESLVEKLKMKNITTDYSWDDSNNDLTLHNFILKGNELVMIDYDDDLIKEIIYETDDDHLAEILNLISNYYPLEIKNEIDEKDKVKLNLGCGNDIKSGYINIDKYNNTGKVDHQWDLGKIEMDDNSVDEIFTSHVFEHIPINDVYGVLEEWERVLKVGGKIVMRLPNLETEMKIWLNIPDDKKWFEVHRIFGGQSYKGNTHFSGHNPQSLKMLIERFNFKVKKCGVGNSEFGEEIQLEAERIPSRVITTPSISTHFVGGPFGEIKGDPNDKAFYIIDFLDPDNDSVVHQQLMLINTWTKPHRKYFTNWLIQIKRNGQLIHKHKFDLTGKNVLISFDTKSMGDNIAWIPYVKEFKEKHNCNVWVSTFWNKLFENSEEYNDLTFVTPGQVVHNLYASYSIGCYDNNSNKNKTNWRLIPLQKVASDFLGLEYKEIIPSIGIDIGTRPIEEKYITISEFSTFKCKFWNYPNGWQTIVDYLNGLGYKVAVISKEQTKLQNILDWTNKSIEETIRNIAHSEFFIGISSGPSWIAWALKKPVVMISGFSSETAEFKTNCERIINIDSCNSCFNDPSTLFDRGDWNWCPRHKGTERQFECTKTITPKMVKESINKIFEDYFYIQEKNIKNLKREAINFKWENFMRHGPFVTAYHEIFAQEDYKHGKCKVNKGDVVVDIGANIGIFTRYAYLKGAKNILSFEPEKNNFECLTKNKPPNCEIFNLAFSDNNNVESLFVNNIAGSHSLINKTENSKLQDIQCITLDKLFEKKIVEKIDFLKVDTEGAELKIFSGITDENLDKINKIAMEYHHMIFNLDNEVRKKFIKRFTDLGFKVYTLHLRDDHLNMLYFWK